MVVKEYKGVVRISANLFFGGEERLIIRTGEYLQKIGDKFLWMETRERGFIFRKKSNYIYFKEK